MLHIYRFSVIDEDEEIRVVLQVGVSIRHAKELLERQVTAGACVVDMN